MVDRVPQFRRGDYPRYIKLVDLVWFLIGDLQTWRLLEEREEETRKVYERLIARPERQETYDTSYYGDWQKQRAEGSLTLEQLRQNLYVQQGIEFYSNKSVMSQLVREGKLASERIWEAQKKVLIVDKIIDQVLHAKNFPVVRAAHDYKGFHFVVAPVGVTDELCYEFRSSKNNKHLDKHLEAMRILAHMDAYFLGRPRIIAHVHVRNSGKEEIIDELADRKLALGFLAYAKWMLEIMAEGYIGVHFDAKYWPRQEDGIEDE